MNSSSMARSNRYQYSYIMSVLVLVAAFAFLIVDASYSQPNTKTTREIAFYKITGPLQVFSLEEKHAKIDDLTWDLAATFRIKEIPREWKKNGTVEFEEREVWVYYYVSLLTVTEASSAPKKTDKKALQLINTPDEIQKIHELGGKIYKIELAPM